MDRLIEFPRVQGVKFTIYTIDTVIKSSLEANVFMFSGKCDLVVADFGNDADPMMFNIDRVARSYKGMDSTDSYIDEDKNMLLERVIMAFLRQARLNMREISSALVQFTHIVEDVIKEDEDCSDIEEVPISDSE